MPSASKSIKLPDPLVLTDGVDPRFEHWLAKMRSRLRSNADHYPTEILQMDYIEIAVTEQPWAI